MDTMIKNLILDQKIKISVSVHWGLRVTQDAYFSLLTHTKQLLLVTFCYTSAGIQASFRTHGRTDGGRTEDGRKDRHRGSRNSYLDLDVKKFHILTYTTKPRLQREKTGGHVSFQLRQTNPGYGHP